MTDTLTQDSNKPLAAREPNGAGEGERAFPAGVQDEPRSSVLLSDPPHPASAWPALGRGGRGAVLLIGFLTLAVGLPRIPPGIYNCDQGDFQLACATLGIAHSPGYVGYATVGWVLTKVLFFVEPTYLISLACLGCVAISLMFLTAILIRVGVGILLSGAISLLLINHDSFWYSMTVPEVYAPSLALLAGITYLLCKYGRLYRPRDLLLAGALYGFLLANRPPGLFFAPGLLAGLAVIELRRGAGWSAAAKRALGTMAMAALVLLAVLALTWVRDAPGTPYNHIQTYAEAYGKLPTDSSTFNARWERVSWLVTGQEFRQYMGSNLGQMRSKLRWIRRQLFVYDRVPFYAMLGLMGLGGFVLMRRWPEMAWTGIIYVVGTTGYLIQYRVHDQAADLLPILFGVSLLIGPGLAKLLPTFFGPQRRVVPIAALVAIGGWTVLHGEIRYNYAIMRYAVPYLQELDFESLPQDSVMMADWSTAKPLWYKLAVEGVRPDIRVITSNHPDEWPRLIEPHLGRPAFYTGQAPAPEGYTLRPWRNVWRLERVALTKTLIEGS